MFHVVKEKVIFLKVIEPVFLFILMGPDLFQVLKIPADSPFTVLHLYFFPVLNYVPLRNIEISSKTSVGRSPT